MDFVNKYSILYYKIRGFISVNDECELVKDHFNERVFEAWPLVTSHEITTEHRFLTSNGSDR